MIVLTVSIAGFLLYLAYERFSVNRWRRSIPLVITVTGTRGKSTVTRLLAAVFKEDGRKVLAKTTGSEAKLLWPDGSETEVRRRGPASIIEQKTILRTAARHNVDCLVAEIMSIHPENHFVESQQILKPDIVAITNVWPDHVDALGHTEGETVRCLSLDIPHNATVFTPEASCRHVLDATGTELGENLIATLPGSSASILESVPGIARKEFVENVELACTVAKHVGVKDEVIGRGLAAAQRDIGAFTIWDWRSGGPERRFFVVNAFAANDPESTSRVLTKVREIFPLKAHRFVGILCLRGDRGDRTEQWIDALRDGAADQFNRLFVTGGHARVLAKRVGSAQVVNSRSPERLMDTMVAEIEDGTVVFGFGNIVGMGRQLVDYWDLTGVVHGI